MGLLTVALSGARAPAQRLGLAAQGSRARHALRSQVQQAAPAVCGVVGKHERQRARVAAPPRATPEVDDLECSIAVPAGSR